MTTKATTTTLEEHYSFYKDIVRVIRRAASQHSATIASSGLESNVILRIVEHFDEYKTGLNNLKSVTGLTTYAQEQEGDNLYDINAEIDALVLLLDAAITTISTSMPTDGQYLQVIELVNNQTVWRTFGSAPLAPLKSDLDAIVAQVI